MSHFKGELTQTEGFRVWPDFHVAFLSFSLSVDSVGLEPVPLTLEGHQCLSLTLNHDCHEPTEGICQIGDKSLLHVDIAVLQGQNGSQRAAAHLSRRLLGTGAT